MKKNLKITIIGAGSSYTPELIEGLIKRNHELPIGELWLVDIEDGKEKVSIIGDLTRRMLAKNNLSHIDVHVTLDRKPALKDADFVCSQFRAGCLEGRIRDERISLKYGMIGQETNGLGGFANACRTIPIALEICKEMEELCPDAWLLNFTNPSGMVTEAILKHTKVKAVGLCNVPVIMQKGIAQMLGADEQDFVLQVAGLNHFIWARQILHEGRDKLQEVVEEILSGNDPLVPQNIPPFEWPTELLRNMGMIPCAYLRYYYTSEDIMKQEIEEANGEGTRGEVVKEMEKRLFDIYRNPELNEKPTELEKRGGQYYSEAACELMSSIYNDKRTIMHVNTRNNGAIAGLPDDCTVEVSCMITKSGPVALNVAPFPTDTLRLIQLMKDFESLTVEAAVTGNRNAAHRALILNPLVTTGTILEQALEETIQANLDYMPQFR
ncbi:TPA: 6-phospho-beta-glucosidase [Vibrio parahaemolyticus]|uniref:6-phospho-beta-glucosidase n=1 Tax=Vibrio parahaemolyticus TaxID=670 RepID=UPI000812D988|nr:6-phospho-beta-glucosidase [Vibrio parahaemolyticus]EGQ9456400.1 6-phospho-beta-glucosidase [Vibrio parahaemolyticus]EJE4687868.1 6-phospho-beta-glucosidase [Vibrio parahaemolyticus]EJK2422429.1 6-phospho-beta-glucosidase [Vibrio parahaemolyticus]OCP71745.1 diacetylchitobiose-6-phosphate hydrolase [Vibrio parahaemolyticus]HCG6867833.1 6-phospho-beta-glucosidase [Vibrio parahaemolyticus]